jgi:hypothetical protein
MKTWERKVSQKHLFRFGRAWDGTEVRDAWTIGEELLGQLREIGVERIRYVTQEEVYEIELEEFLKLARELDQSEWVSRTEPQWALPRRLWRLKKRTEKQLALQL